MTLSDDEDGDGLSFGGKQHLRVGNSILLGISAARALARGGSVTLSPAIDKWVWDI